MVLNAALPEVDLLCTECPLFRAIVAQNKHLRKMSMTLPVSDPPIASTNAFECPQFMSSSYEKETSLLEEIFPHSRNLDFVELKQLVSMAPYVILPSLNSFSRQVAGGGQAHHRRSILVDVGANNFYGCETVFGIIGGHSVNNSSRVAGVQKI